MSYLKAFGVLTGVGVDVFKIFRSRGRAGVLKRGAGVESESEKCDSAHLWSQYEAHCHDHDMQILHETTIRCRYIVPC